MAEAMPFQNGLDVPEQLQRFRTTLAFGTSSVFQNNFDLSKNLKSR